jgi:uncharacterized coiled-coil protein SlyX
MSDELEIKIAYQERAIEQLNEALVEKEKRIASLEEAVARIEKAMRILASRTTTAGDVVGAHPEEDPVPRSG